MKGVIMAGGRGKRLFPLTRLMPKPLIPVMNRPVMEHCIEWMKSQGIHEIAITLQYLSDEIKHYFGDGQQLGVRLHYFEESKPLGTAGGIRCIKSFLDETFIVASGDILTDFKIAPAIDFHRKQHSSLTILTTKVDRTKDYGFVIKDPEGRIKEFIEKPSYHQTSPHEINAGIYIVEPAILEYVPKDAHYDFAMDLFPVLIDKREKLYGYELSGYWKDIGQFVHYREAHEEIFRNHLLKEEQFESEQIFVGRNCEIHPDARLKGPLYIGEGCRIHQGTSIGPYTVIGNNTVIDSGVLIENSIVWESVIIGSNSIIEKAIVATETQVGSKVKLLENCVISSGSFIGNNSIISRNCKVGTARKVPDNSVIFNYEDKIGTSKNYLIGNITTVNCGNKVGSDILHLLVEEKTSEVIDSSEGIRFIHNPDSWTQITIDNQKDCFIVHSQAENQNMAKENTNHYVEKIINYQKV